jgi:signal transduction histidine kinase
MLEAAGSDLGRQWERETTVRVMTAYVAHELNHPLGTIINLVNTLSRHLAKPVVRPLDIDGYLKGIKAEALRASTIIKQLRLLTERRPTTKSSVDLTEVCREEIDRLRPPGGCQAGPDPPGGPQRSDSGERSQGTAGNGALQFPDQQYRRARRPGRSPAGN